MRHGAGREALGDRQSGLDLRDRDGWAGGDQLQQVAQLGERPLVDEGGELVVQLVPAGGDCPLQQVRRLHVVEGVDDVLVVGVVLATPLQVAVVAGVGQAGVGVPGQNVLAQRLPADAADDRRRPAEAHVHHLRAEPHHLEDLRAAVAVHGGDARLREHLEHAVLTGGLEPLLGVRAVEGVVGGVGVGGDGQQGQTRADGVGPVAEQAGDAVHVAGVVGSHDQAGLHA